MEIYPVSLNQSSQLKIKKGYEYFSQNYKTDLSFNYVGQIMKNHLCAAYDIALDNSDISNNFTTGAPINTSTGYFFSTNSCRRYVW